MDTARIFIGSGEASLLERKTLIYSLQKNSDRKLEVFVFNGTHNSVERIDGSVPQPAPMSLTAKYANVTEFSNYRFLIPQLCNHQGRAIWLDSDMIALRDIGNLFDAEMGDACFLAKSDAYKHGGGHCWGLSVMLIDCQRTHFDLETYVREISEGQYSFTDMHQMSPKFLAKHPFAIGEIDKNWNVFDSADANTKLIHYTNLMTQPWKFAGHKQEKLWFDYFNQARKAGFVTDKDIEVTRLRAYSRQDVAKPRGVIRRKFASLIG